MPVIEYGSVRVELDDYGFLVNQESWNEKVAEAIADYLGVSGLTTEKMEIIRFMREYYREFNAFPILRSVCRNVHKPRECVNDEFIDPMKAWKIAGLPNLEVVSSISADEAGKVYRILAGD
ncbi:MAG TPA: TusE/DsrC/DsvC family sulfur relay protein [Dissulfurispiraceae bacterium]|nr:TusE/DsrC/DsvC family sulfur relay protein [Dissulfurispiraceae bacterium]